MTADSRGWAFLRGLGSLVLFLLVLVVPPIVLTVAVGWPLPTSIPDLDAIDSAARSGISDAVIVNTLAVIAWLAWRRSRCLSWSRRSQSSGDDPPFTSRSSPVCRSLPPGSSPASPCRPRWPIRLSQLPPLRS